MADDNKKEIEPTLLAVGWNCPPGWQYPQCLACGHVFVDVRPVRKEDRGLWQLENCRFCVEA